MPGYQPLGKFPPFHQSEGKVSFSQIRGGVINAEEIILAGGTKGRIRSENYDPTNETGWGIFGDGSASFYGDVFFGKNAVFQGDIISSNWDGAVPAILVSFDSSATKGFYLDTASGAAQFMGPVRFGGENNARFEFLKVGTAPRLELYTPTALAGIMAASGNTLWLSGPAGGLLLEGDNNAFIDLLGSEIRFLTSTSPATRAVISDTNFSLTVPVLLNNGSAAAPALAFTSDPDTGIYRSTANGIGFATGGSRRFNMSNTYLTGTGDTGGVAIFSAPGSASAPVYTFTNDTDTGMYRSSANTIDFATGGVRRMGLSQGSGVIFGAGGTSTADEIFRWNGSTKTIAIHDQFPDIGNHEVLRADRGAGTQTTVVGYFSSWEFDPDTGERRKEDIVSLAESPRWNREWFYQIRPVDFRRISTGEREFGFILDEWQETADDMKYLTTKGDRWGGQPHEVALLAATILEVQDHERRIRELEAEVAMLRGEKEKHA